MMKAVCDFEACIQTPCRPSEYQGPRAYRRQCADSGRPAVRILLKEQRGAIGSGVAGLDVLSQSPVEAILQSNTQATCWEEMP